MFFNDRLFVGVLMSEVIALEAETGAVIRKFSPANAHVYGLVVLPGLRNAC